jgi:hypothetical protein
MKKACATDAILEIAEVLTNIHTKAHIVYKTIDIY